VVLEKMVEQDKGQHAVQNIGSLLDEAI
jgi:hypothetical protein